MQYLLTYACRWLEDKSAKTVSVNPSLFSLYFRGKANDTFFSSGENDTCLTGEINTIYPIQLTKRLLYRELNIGLWARCWQHTDMQIGQSPDLHGAYFLMGVH